MPVDHKTVPVDDRRAFEAGLDALEAPVLTARPGPGAVIVRSVLPPLVAVAAFIVLWQLAHSSELKPSYALPSPLDVLRTFSETVRDGRAWDAISIRVTRGAMGFLASLVVGTVLGLTMWRSRWLRAALGPFVSGLQSLPSVAWVPAAIIWFGLSDAASTRWCCSVPCPRSPTGYSPGSTRCPHCSTGWAECWDWAPPVASGMCCCLRRCRVTWPVSSRAGRSPGVRWWRLSSSPTRPHWASGSGSSSTSAGS